MDMAVPWRAALSCPGARLLRLPPSRATPAAHSRHRCGSFQLTAGGTSSGGFALTQRVTSEAGVNRWASNLGFPVTVAGDPNDGGDRTIEVAVHLPTGDRAGDVAVHDPTPQSARPAARDALAPGGDWAALCGRVSDVRTRDKNTRGVCLRANATSWLLAENQTALGAGALPLAGRESAWLVLRLAFDRTTGTVEAHAGGSSLGTFVVAVRSGMVALQSGWNVASFDDFSSVVPFARGL